MARNTIAAGVRELVERREPANLAISTSTCDGLEEGASRSRKPTRSCCVPSKNWLTPSHAGIPESPLRWTCKSTAKLAEELTRQNHPVTDRTVARLLKQAGYSLQANRKTREGSSHPDRNAQFEYINKQVLAFQKQNQPVISVDTKKKELVGEFKNPGQEWQPKGEPEKVKVHDFPDKHLGKAIPYGVYDLASNEGWVSVGIDHDTAQFAAASIRRWWTEMGSQRFPRANKLLITADGGGSNSSRNRLWKKSLQELADELDLTCKCATFHPAPASGTRSSIAYSASSPRTGEGVR